MRIFALLRPAIVAAGVVTVAACAPDAGNQGAISHAYELCSRLGYGAVDDNCTRTFGRDEAQERDASRLRPSY